MSRLTWYDKDDGVYTQEVSKVDYDGHTVYTGEAINKLAHLEDLEEQGLLLKLPCKVGDTVYVLYDNKIYIGRLSCFEKTQTNDYAHIFIAEIALGKDYKLGDFGETVFLTKEEAEQKLTELNGVE